MCTRACCQIPTRLQFPASSPRPSSCNPDAWLKQLKLEGPNHREELVGLTPLHFAVIAQRVDIARALLDRGADVESPLHASYANFELLRGWTVLQHACCYRDNPQLVALLLERKADPRRTTTRGHGAGLAALSYACMRPHTRTILSLLQHDISLAYPDEGPSSNAPPNVPFSFLASYGHSETLHAVQLAHPELCADLFRQGFVGRGVRVNWVKICFDMKGDYETVRFFLDQVKHTYTHTTCVCVKRDEGTCTHTPYRSHMQSRWRLSPSTYPRASTRCSWAPSRRGPLSRLERCARLDGRRSGA